MAIRPLLLGHRGARAVRSIAENTLASFDLALHHGCDGFEFDVRRTRDGEAVICHDPVWRGEVAGKKANLVVADVPAAGLGPIAKLEEVLARYRGSAFLDIELKVAGIEGRVLELLMRYPPQRGYVITSFLPEVPESMDRSEAALPLGLICESRAQLARWERVPGQYLAVHHRLVSAELVAEVQRAGKKLMAWTVNEPDAMRRLRDWGIDGIISDQTELLVRTLGGE